MHSGVWPDYGTDPLWSGNGTPVVLADLDLPAALVERLRKWNEEYREEWFPLDGPEDAAGLWEGAELLHRTREALGPDYQAVVTRSWGANKHYADGDMSANADPGNHSGKRDTPSRSSRRTGRGASPLDGPASRQGALRAAAR